MKSIIQQLYDGEINGFENIRVPGEAYEALNDSITRERQHFAKGMSPEDGQRFEDLEKLYTTSAEMWSQASFAYGLKLGLTLMAEAAFSPCAEQSDSQN